MSKRDEIISDISEVNNSEFGKEAIVKYGNKCWNAAIEEVRKEFYRRFENTEEKRQSEFYEGAPMWVLDFLDSLTEEKK